jgi:hypothetical protein
MYYGAPPVYTPSCKVGLILVKNAVKGGLILIICSKAFYSSSAYNLLRESI